MLYPLMMMILSEGLAFLSFSANSNPLILTGLPFLGQGES